VRIIGGTWKRSKLPVADRPGLRPTPDRVRETVFNWLGQRLDGWRCLDAFAGSGALGVECASRGAATVVLLECDPALARSLEATAARLVGAAEVVRVVRADALAWMRRAEPASFDLILLDPPFDGGLVGPALAAAVPLLRGGGFVYLESGAPPQLPDAHRLQAHRRGRAGAVHFEVLRLPEHPPAKLAATP
jgi:16S rRNA (guanine(966)-N(2))-methyltransferase RsmD